MRALLVALALVGCGRATEAPVDHTAPGEPVDGDTLVVAAPFDPGNVNPLVAPYALSGVITELVTPGLVRRRVTEGGLEYEPALAESWTFSEDGLSLTYTLREGLVWEDGTPLTSADVAFSWSLLADPAVASNWNGDARHVESVETPDPRTVVFRFVARQNPILLQGYTIRGIVPKHVLGDADRATLRGHPSGRDPTASGSFDVGSWKPDESVLLVPNPKAPDSERPHLERILFRIIPEYATRTIELEKGGIDLLTDIEIADVPRLSKDPRLRLVRMTADSMQYIGYDLKDPRFADARVRRALTLGLDRDRLIADLLTVDGEVYGRPCTGTVGPDLGPWHAEIEPLPYDPTAAGALLDEAGWKDPDGDGLRERDGSPLRFTLMVQTGFAELKRIAILSQAQWAAIGVKLDIEMVEPTRFAQRAREHDFEAILWSFGNNPKVDPSIQWRSDGQYNWYC